ncbi:hypothetical protein P8452_43353 [Trifolium repens]|nr:hypothetical protein P8452_43353 [Trifolium repens]
MWRCKIFELLHRKASHRLRASILTTSPCLTTSSFAIANFSPSSSFSITGLQALPLNLQDFSPFGFLRTSVLYFSVDSLVKLSDKK